MVLQIAQFNPERINQDRRKISVPVTLERRINPERRRSPDIVSGLNKLGADIDRFDRKAQQAMLYALSPIPTARRISSLPDTLEGNNLARAGLLTGMAAASFPGDFREMGAAGRELIGKMPVKQVIPEFPKVIKELIPNMSKAVSNPENIYQRPLSVFKGTMLSGLTDRFEWLSKMDKTLYYTKFGELVRNGLKIEVEDSVKKVVNGKKITHYKFAGNGIQKLIGNALLRTPVIGIALGCLLEIPAIINSTKKGDTAAKKGKSLFKQVCKSAGYIGLMTAGISIVGAAFASSGTLAILVGMAIGSSVALMASKGLNKIIDKIMV